MMNIGIDLGDRNNDISVVAITDSVTGETYLIQEDGHHRFLKNDEIVQEGDEYFSKISRSWKPCSSLAANLSVARSVESMGYTVVRRHRNEVYKARKWSCGHGRDEGVDCCPVCSAVWYKRVVD